MDNDIIFEKIISRIASQFFLIIRFLAIFLFGVLLINLNLNGLVVVALSVSLACVLFFGPPLLTTIKKRRIEKEEYQESLTEGGIEEARPFRGLTEEEKTILAGLYNRSKFVHDNLVLIVAAFIVGDFFLIRFFPIINFLLYVFIGEGLVISLGLKYWIRYLDFRSPVFRVQGKAIREKTSGKRRDYYYITIRKIRFTEENYNSLSNFYFTIGDQDEVAVEYSPRTKHVWKIYKTEDLK